MSPFMSNNCETLRDFFGREVSLTNTMKNLEFASLSFPTTPTNESMICYGFNKVPSTAYYAPFNDGSSSVHFPVSSTAFYPSIQFFAPNLSDMSTAAAAAAAVQINNGVVSLPNLNESIQNNAGKRKKTNRERKVFSEKQRKMLEDQFKLQKYIAKPARKRLSEKINLSDSQVKVWFQNRRMKWRHSKEYKDDISKTDTMSINAKSDDLNIHINIDNTYDKVDKL